MVNIYTDRHYDTDQELYDKFTEETGIIVNVVKAFESDVVEANVPEHLCSTDNLWTALTVRARVITYALDRVDSSELSTYEALTEPEWAAGLVNNMAIIVDEA